jgi:DNA polymerase sliding clamp subunit (PCNA homolog)
MDLEKNQCSVVFDKKEFDDIVSKAKNTTESKSILPILSNFLIEIEHSKYFVKATDLENYIKIEGRPEQSEVSCTLCINSKKLSDIVKSLSSATFTLTLVNDPSTQSSYVQIQSGRSKFKLTLAEASEFPAFPEIEEDMISNNILGSMLLEGLERTDYAVAKEDAMNPPSQA